MSKIRVTFNRQLTYAEIETFRAQMADMHAQDPGNKTTWHFTPDRKKLYIQTPHFDSRYVYDVIAEQVATSYVNVHPVAVRTFDDSVTEAPEELAQWERSLLDSLY